jgi:hypothetical protein
LVSPSSSDVARATIEQLPDSAHLIKLESDLEWPGSALDLLAGSMHLVKLVAETHDVDPGRPKVSDFGRRLYNLPVSRYQSSTINGPVEKKLAATHIGRRIPELRAVYEATLRRWLGAWCLLGLAPIRL